MNSLREVLNTGMQSCTGYTAAFIFFELERTELLLLQLSNRSSLLHRYLASVQLATKVIDCETKLRATLLHELCHVATWVLPPHAAKVQISAKDRSCAFLSSFPASSDAQRA